MIRDLPPSPLRTLITRRRDLKGAKELSQTFAIDFGTKSRIHNLNQYVILLIRHKNPLFKYVCPEMILLY